MARHVKVGMIFECTSDGPDKKVCKDLAERLLPTLERNLVIEVVSETKGNKKKLIAEAGTATAILLERGPRKPSCDHVVIVWDLYPAWRQDGKKPSLHDDRAQILESLKAEDVDTSKVHLVCIIAELESWLIADHRALNAFMIELKHPHPLGNGAPKVAKPEADTNPKKLLKKLFSTERLVEYNPYTHPPLIAKKIMDVSRLERCATFRHFALMVAGIVLESSAK